MRCVSSPPTHVLFLIYNHNPLYTAIPLKAAQISALIDYLYNTCASFAYWSETCQINKWTHLQQHSSLHWYLVRKLALNISWDSEAEKCELFSWQERTLLQTIYVTTMTPRHDTTIRNDTTMIEKRSEFIKFCVYFCYKYID